MSNEVESFRVPEGKKFDLGGTPTKVDPIYQDKKQYQELLSRQVKQLSKLQYRLYAADTHSLLIVLQAMDAAGKDSVIRHVMSGINPQGCQVYSFKHPSANELDHDFLWRTSQSLPERGRIGIFNRSYYEEVLIVRVHPEILQAEKLPNGAIHDGHLWEHRYQSIRDHERHLHRNGTRVVKFFLHISRDEQRRRFLERIEEPEKNWKFSIADVEERQYWDKYMNAYEACIGATSTDYAPWYVIPADDKRNARLFVSKIILDELEGLHPQFPELTNDRLREASSHPRAPRGRPRLGPSNSIRASLGGLGVIGGQA